MKFLNLLPDVNGEPTYPVWDYAWSETYINSKVDDEKLDRILAIYDYTLSDEGSILCVCGIEGKSYGYDEDGNITYEGYCDTPGEVFNSIRTLGNLVSWLEGRPNAEIFPSTLPQECLDIRENLIEQARAVPVPEYNYECTNEFIRLNSDFSLNLTDDLVNIMTGTEDVEKMWNDIIEGYRLDGMDGAIEAVNKAVAECGEREKGFP